MNTETFLLITDMACQNRIPCLTGMCTDADAVRRINDLWTLMNAISRAEIPRLLSVLCCSTPGAPASQMPPPAITGQTAPPGQLPAGRSCVRDLADKLCAYSDAIVAAQAAFQVALGLLEAIDPWLIALGVGLDALSAMCLHRADATDGALTDLSNKACSCAPTFRAFKAWIDANVPAPFDGVAATLSGVMPILPLLNSCCSTVATVDESLPPLPDLRLCKDVYIAQSGQLMCRNAQGVWSPVSPTGAISA